MVHHFRHAHLPGAVGAAEERSLGLDPVPGDLAATVRADGRELVDGAFETVKDVLFSSGYDFK
jgi:hypothetical protein